MGLTVVIAGCARSTASALPGVLANVEALAGLYDRAAFVFVENDSADDTKALLKQWTAAHAQAHLVDLEGLEAKVPKFTTRLAACRNAYVDFIRTSEYAVYDHLIVLDCDDVNQAPLDIQAAARARDWLDANPAAAVFSNSAHVYYDIWALRHPTWCPGDCWAEVRRESQRLTEPVAKKRFIYDRQIPIPLGSEPIEVESAFGGLGIYDLKQALKAKYDGLGPDGAKACEHVAFNRELARASGRKLYILPFLTTAATGSRVVPIPESMEVAIHQGGRGCRLSAPVGHAIHLLRDKHPLYDRRLPMLATLLSEASPGSAIADIGANIGDTIAACRLQGCASRIIAIEASLSFFKHLLVNQIRAPQLFDNVEPVWAFVGRPGDDPRIEMSGGTAHHAEASSAEAPGVESAPLSSLEQIMTAAGIVAADVGLVKIDTDGYDQVIILNEFDYLTRAAPILWTEAQISTRAEEADWRRILADGARSWPNMIAFDNNGFAFLAGGTAQKIESCMDLISYTRRHRALPKGEFGGRPVPYPDLVLFPDRFTDLFEQFRASLPELDPQL